MRQQQQRSRFRVDKERMKARGSQRPRSKYDSIFINGVTKFTPRQGMNCFRVVMAEDMDYWCEVIHVHERVGSKNSTYLCLEKMAKQPCPVCEHAQDAQRSGDKEEFERLRENERVVAYIIDRNDEKAGLKVYDMSWTREQEINTAAETKSGNIIDFYDPDEGFDILIHRSGQGLKTRYTGLQIDRETSPLASSNRQADAWLEEARKRPIKSLFKFYDYEYLQDVLAGKVESKDEEGEEDDGGYSSRRREPDDRYEERRDRQAPTTRRGGRDAGDRQEEREVRGNRGRPSDDERDDDERESRPSQGRGEETDRPTRTTRSVRDDDPPRRGRDAYDEDEQREARGGRTRSGRDEEPDDQDPPAARTTRRGRSDAEAEREREQEDEAETQEAARYSHGRSRAGDEERQQPTERRRVTRPADGDRDPPRRGRAREDEAEGEEEQQEAPRRGRR